MSDTFSLAFHVDEQSYFPIIDINNTDDVFCEVYMEHFIGIYMFQQSTTYKHYKGNSYRLIGIGEFTRDNKAYVFYEPLYECGYKLFARTCDEFFQHINPDTFRFTKLS